MHKTDDLRRRIHSHRCFSHPIFRHWAKVDPDPTAIGALFHQIQMFCASTRPGGVFPDELTALGMDRESELITEIVESEEDHGPELATMAGFILNRSAGVDLCPDLRNQLAIEMTLKDSSDELLGMLPGYERKTGLTIQARRAIAVFERRFQTGRETTLKNLGTALALEIISNRHLIPGEVHCLLESDLYDVSITDPEMHYLLEHSGESGAENQHEKNAIAAVESMLDDESGPLILAGIDDFLNTLANLWDVLDTALLQSGQPVATAGAVA